MLRRLLALLCVPVAAAAAQTFVVDAANRPGANFTDLQTAIAAVPDGAVLVVRPGQYWDFTIDGKSVTVIGQPGAFVRSVLGSRVQNLGSTQSVAICGIGLQSFFTTGASTIRCQDNAGAVTLDTIPALSGVIHLACVRCDHVFVRLTAFSGPATFEASNVQCDGCVFSSVTYTWPGIDQIGGTTQLVDCLAVGDPGSGVPVIRMTGGDLRLLGSTRVQGAGTGRAVDGSGTLRRAPGTTVTGTATPIGPTVLASVQDMPHVTLANGPIGAPITASLHGPLGHLGVLAVGFPGPSYAIPGLADRFFWNPVLVATQTVGVMVAGAPVQGTVTVPPLPGFLGLHLVWQGLTYDPTVGLQTSNPQDWIAR